MGFTDMVSDAGLSSTSFTVWYSGQAANMITVLDSWVKTRSYIAGYV